MNSILEEPLEPGLPIIDAHHHLWKQPPFSAYPPYPIEDLASDIDRSGHRIFATVYNDSLVGYRETGPAHLRVVGEIETVENAVRAHAKAGGRHRGICAGIVGSADLTLGAVVGETLDQSLAASPRFRGIRHMTAFADELPNWGASEPGIMLRPSFKAGLAELARRKLRFDAWLFQNQLLEIVQIARAVPDVRVVINHLGGPRGTGRYLNRPEQAFAHWVGALREVAACPNVFMKLGGMHIPTTGIDLTADRAALSQTAAEAQRRHILTAIDLFGADRCMFESNAPVDSLAIPYGNLWNSFKRITADFSASDKTRLFSGTAASVYGIPMGEP